MKYKILKRLGLGLFIVSFVLNVVVTSYAKSLVKTYNTGATEVIGAALSGGGPFMGLVGAALLAAGLICEATSDDPTDGAVEYFVHNCIVNDHFADTALEVIYNNIEIDENGNISYKQVIDNINAYVEANNIIISSAEAVTFNNGVLRVAPEIIKSMAKDYREWWAGEISNKYGLKTYTNGSFGLTFGWNSDIPIDSDLYNLYMQLVPYNEGNNVERTTYFVFTSLGDIPLSVYCDSDISCKYAVYYEKSSNGVPAYYVGSTPFLNEEYFESLFYNVRSSGTVNSEPVFSFYDENGSLVSSVNALGKSIWINGGNAVSWSGINMYGLQAILDMTDTIPLHNRVYIGSDADVAPPVSDIYDGLLDDILNVPVIDFPVSGDGTIAIDGDTAKDLDEAFKNVVGVIDGIGENVTDKDIADTITDELDKVIEDTQIRNPSKPVTPSVGYPEVGDLKTDGLIDKFPFCIPFDLISLVRAFEAEPEAPYVEIPFVVPVIGISDNIVLDFSKFEYAAVVLRSLEVVGFVLFLLLKTRDLIKG